MLNRVDPLEGINNVIPRRIFLYWCAPSLSYLRYLCLWSLRKFNPNWDIILYMVDCDVKKKTWDGDISQDFEHSSFYDYRGALQELNIKIVKKYNTSYPIHTGDMFRYAELCKRGGIYIDTDMFWVAPIDSLYHEIQDSKAAVSYHSELGFQIGLLAAQSDSDLFIDWLDEAHSHFLPNASYQACGVDALVNLLSDGEIISPVPCDVALSPQLVEEMGMRYPDTYLIDGKRLYEVDGGQAELLFDGSAKLDPEFCIHLYGGSPAFQKYNQIITEDNIHQFNGPCFDIMKKVLNEA